MISYRSRLDMSPGGIPLVLHVSQYDDDFSLIFDLFASKGTFTIESGTTVQIRGTKTDGEGYSVDASINTSSSLVTVAGNKQMTAAAGKNIFELTLWKGEKELNTANFVLDVEPAALDKDTIGSQSVIKELVAVIDRTDEIIAAANRADSAQQQIAALTTRAETAATNAEESEQTASQAASQAQSAAASAISQINSTKEAAVYEVTSTKSSAVSAINNAKNSGIDELTTAKDDATSAVDAKKRQAVSAISTQEDQAISDIDDAVATHMTEINRKAAQIDAQGDQAISDIDDAVAAHMVEINRKAAQIAAIATNADEIAAEARTSAQNAENHMSTLDSQMKALEAAMQDVSIDPDDLGLYQDEDTYYVYPTYKGIRSENGIPLASSGGGGGGGGDVIAAKLTVENTSGWLSKTIPTGAACPVSFTWSSIEDDMPTGDGALRITVNDVVRSTMQIKQGNVSVDLAPYLSTGTNKVKVRISDTYDQGKTTTFNIMSIALSLSSSFDTTREFTGAFSFPYTPIGAVDKTVYFFVDGKQIGTQETPVSGRQLSFTIPAQRHGAHSLRVYFESVINNETVRSNELYYEFIYVETLNDTVIIASSFNETTQPQYASIPIAYRVYDPASLTAQVEISVNGTVVSRQTVDRTEQSYTVKANDAGTMTVEISSGGTTKTFTLTITESEIDVEAETEDLVLYLSAQGRSNQEATKDQWSYQDINCSFSGFSWSSDGWQRDSDGITVMRVSGDARITIPYKPFATDFRSTGKTIELEFATRNVLDYDSVIMSCMADNRGFSLTAQRASLKSEQSEINTQYKEEDHIRIAFVAEKRSEDKLLLVYINGIPSGVVQYPTDDDFSQPTPVNISVGSNDCTIDLYCIRIYDNDLTRYQILNNWIADTQDGSLMLDRYVRNNIYDAYGKIVVANLPSDLPYFILNAEQLPQYKGDKKTITGSYTDPLYPSKSFTFEGCQINVQGTSSAPYARKNYDMQFKSGFELASGHADNYVLRTGVIPFNRFVLKADVASSEGANNVELVRLYNDACPYKTPEMIEDSRVRWGIDGFPIVVFWNDTVTGEVSFLGKYNFNLPKRAPAPYGYANDDEMESWEFQNNTSDLLLFKSDYFDMHTYTDDEGNVLPNWRKDFEARFPSDEWLDIDILQEFVSFVVSTDRSKATGENLEQSVTYEDVTYTQDTADYRLAKFRAEFPTYAQLDTFLFYYIFTELFLMVDSRAKNLFIGFNGDNVTEQGRVATRKATAQPYDMDTAIGTNNEGSLVFGYSLEDIDHLAGGADIFNAQTSVLWNNVRDAYPAEIIQMYQRLRSAGTLSYASVEQRFSEHQAKWPEAVWLEDSWFKYILPLIAPDPGKEATAVYLPMMQGSKDEQRKWWLINRFRYMDSKFNAGEALSQVIQLRGYAKANITVTPYADIYPAVRYGSYLVRQRGERETPTTLVCPLDSVNDTEIYIYSALQLASVGDLSGLKVGFADFSMATRLQAVKIGDADSNYDNPNLYALSLGSNTLLKSIDVRNCSGLGDTTKEGHTQTTVDLSGCEILEDVYFDGTKITGLTLPNGGVLKRIHVPATMTNITIMNQRNITEFVIPSYENISTLRLENVPTMDTKVILNAIPAGTRVRLIGVAWEAQDATEIETLLNRLDAMRGLDESGGNVDTAQVSGTIHTEALTGEQIAAYNQRYPYLRITADFVESTLTFVSYNGETVLKTVTCYNGVMQDTAPALPARPNSSDGHYSYTAIGWNTTYDSQTADPDATKDVIADRTVYPAYTWTVRTYTVTWVNQGTTLETDSNVAWGTVPHYDGATPTYDGQTSTGWLPDPTQPITGNTTFTAQYLPVYTVTFKNDTGSTTLDTQRVVQGQTATYGGTTPTSSEDASLAWLGWATAANSHRADAVLTNVQASMTVYAAFESAVEVVEITDTWDQIIQHIDAGDYSTRYKIGNYKPLDLGTEGIVNMQIVAMDEDDLASGGKAPLTFIAMELLATKHNMNDTATTVGGWETSKMRTYLNDTILPLIPSNVATRLKRVNKVSHSFVNSSFIDITSIDTVWIPNYAEIGGRTSNSEASGVMYSKLFGDARRAKGNIWWLRTAQTAIKYNYVRANGSMASSYANDANQLHGVCLGFCLGLEQETIEDSWETILANQNPSASYSIGDTKMIDLGTEGKHLMEIVAFDADDKADGTGKAKITWISKDLLNTTHVMNANKKTVDGETEYTAGGWEHSDMRAYLKNTIKPLIPAIVRNGIVEVTKVQSIYTGGAKVIDGQTTTDDVWIPSNHEVGLGTSYESTGAVYGTKFNSASARIKKRNGSANNWWLRSAYSTYSFRCVGGNGSDSGYGADSARGVALGFCTD